MRPTAFDLTKEIIIDGVKDYFANERDLEELEEIMDTFINEYMTLKDEVIKDIEEILEEEAKEQDKCPSCYSELEPSTKTTTEFTDRDGNRGQKVGWCVCPECGHEEAV